MNYLQHITEKANTLPNDKNELLSINGSEQFALYIREVFLLIQTIYTTDNLTTLSNLRFINVVMNLYDALAILTEWTKTNHDVLHTQRINAQAQQIIDEQNTELNKITETLKAVIGRIDEVQAINEQIIQEKNYLETKEKHYQNLKNNEQSLQKRKVELEALEKEIKDGKLEELAQEVQELEAKYQTEEKHKIELLKQKQEALERQNKQEEQTQIIVNQTLALGRGENLLKQIEKDCNEYNDSLQEKLKNEAEEVKLRIAFNKETSKNAIDSNASIGEDLKKIEDLLKKVEEGLTSKIK